MKQKTIEEIVKEINERIEQPFVTPTFGDNWKNHTKHSYMEDDLSVDSIIDIAWKQGRRAHLLERELANVLDSIKQDDLHLEKIIEGESISLRDEFALKALENLHNSGFSYLTATPQMIADHIYKVADAIMKARKYERM